MNRLRLVVVDGPSVDRRSAVSDDTPMATLTIHVHTYVTGRVRRREITTDTARRVRTVLGTFSASFGRRTLDNMSARDVERWLGQRGHLSSGTRRNELSIVRSFVTWLQRERLIRRNPMVGIQRVRVPRAVPRAITRDEAHRLWVALPDARARAITALMLGMGLRRCEVLRLEVGDWDRSARCITVRGKGDHERTLPVPDYIARHLDVYLSSIGATAGPMIRTEDGRRGISNAWLGALMRTWMEDAGVKHAPGDGKACHSLRHTAASELVDVEPDLRVAQQFLGHRSLTSTQVYLRRIELGKMRAAMEARVGVDTAA